MTGYGKRWLGLLMTLLVFLPGAARAADDALDTAVALNYCHMSLYRITAFNDRVVLDEEYGEIINNINLSKIRDEEIINLLKTLMDTISDFKLKEGDRDFLVQAYEHQVRRALYTSFSDVKDAVAGSTTPYMAAAKVLIKVGSLHSNYRNNMAAYRRTLDRSVWELDRKAIVRVNDARKNFLAAYWRLMKKYDIPDEWRLTERQMEQLTEALKDENGARRLRKLVRMEAAFAAYPPFWYFLGQAAQAEGQAEAARKAYDRFARTQKGFFREDGFASSVLMHRIELLDPDRDAGEIADNLAAMIKESPQDVRKNLFAALWYLKLGRYDEARERLMVNIDNNRNLAMSRVLLADVYARKLDRERLVSLIDEMLRQDAVRNQDVIAVIGRLPEAQMLARMKDPIAGIYVSLAARPLKKDTLILTVPDRWVIDDPEHFRVTLDFRGRTAAPGRVTSDRARRLVSYHFDEAVDLDAFIKQGKPESVSFTLVHPSGPVTLVGEMAVVSVAHEKGLLKKGLDTTAGLLGRGTGGTTEREATVGFGKRLLKTQTRCWRIVADDRFEPCP